MTLKPNRSRNGRRSRCSTNPKLLRLLAHLKGHWLYMPTVLAAYTGMRRGEVLGLRWRDIDFDKGTLQIAQAIELIGGKICVTAPKTERSSRTINLPASLLPEPPASEGASRFAAEAGAWQVRSSFHIARGQGNSSRRVLQHFHLHALPVSRPSSTRYGTCISPIFSRTACLCMWSVLVPDIRGRVLRLMLIRICLVMKTSLQPNKLTKFFAALSVPIRCQRPVSTIESKG